MGFDRAVARKPRVFGRGRRILSCAYFEYVGLLKLNLKQTTNNIVRTIGSAVSNSLFSLSVERGYLGGYMAYVFFVLVTMMALCLTSLLPRDSEEHRV